MGYLRVEEDRNLEGRESGEGVSTGESLEHTRMADGQTAVLVGV